MNIPVYEEHDGIGYNAFIKTTAGSITPTRSGIVGTLERVTLRKVTSSRGYSRRPLPENYKTLTKDQAIAALEQCEYGRLVVSMTGTAMIEHFNLESDKQWGEPGSATR